MRFFYIAGCFLTLFATTAAKTVPLRLPASGLAEIGIRVRSRKYLRSGSSANSRVNLDPQEYSAEEVRQAAKELGFPAQLGNAILNATRSDAPAPAPPPQIPRRPGPMQDDPYTNATGCHPFPCEMEDHYRPPIEPSLELPLPQCGLYGSREVHLAWNANNGRTENLTVDMSTTVRVHVGWDKLHDRAMVKTFQPSYLMSYKSGMDDYHDCREVHKGWLGYFKVKCQQTVSHHMHSADEFKAEWGIGELVIENATQQVDGTYTPSKCIPDTFAPNLESMEMGSSPEDTQYIRYVVQSRAPFLGSERILPTTLPTLWLPWRCATCTVPNPAYWAQLFGARPPLNLSALVNSTNATFQPPPPLTFPQPASLNLSMVPEKPPWSKRVLMEPPPPGLAKWAQIVNPWDGIILRFDECVKARPVMISWTPLNSPPSEIGNLEPRGFRATNLAVQTRADDAKLVTTSCGNVTIRPPDTLITQNLGKLYEINIPEGTFYDYAEIPNNSSGWKFNVTVRDIIRPHVLSDWAQAFYPLASHTGRYPWHNITIKFDEPMMLNPRFKSHMLTLDPRNPAYKKIDIDLHNEELVSWLDHGRTLHINPFGHAVDSWTGDPVGLELGADYRVTLEPSVICDLFGNNFTGISTCPKDCREIAPKYPYEPCTCTGEYQFQVASSAQIEMRKKIAFMLKWVRRRMNDTLQMFHMPTAPSEDSIDGTPLVNVWSHSEAGTRMRNSMFYVGQAQSMLNDPDGLPSIEDLTKVYDALVANKFEPRGSAFADPWVCKDLETHSMPGVARCSYTSQKSRTGFETQTQTDAHYFREGCMCQVHWKGGCPHALHTWPTFKDFGFHSMDEKFVHNNVRTDGGPANYVCWYWSTPDKPELGYTASASNMFTNLDASQQFYCAHPRIPEQPCSTLRYWEWDIRSTQKLYYNNASAWRPTTETLPR